MRVATALARALRDSGLQWHPLAGDAFVIDRIEAEDQVFILSDMTIEAHEFTTGTVLGFNGTTEWALDSVAKEDALWLPAEHQLRDLLGSAFRSLTLEDGYLVEARIDGEVRRYRADVAADAYAKALLALLDSITLEP